jgi:hypothetical protein
MVQHLPDAYRFDPEDPRAPSEEHWARMTLEERARVVAMLPAEVPDELQPPEGDCHRKAKSRTTDTLDDFFQRIGRKIYVSSEQVLGLDLTVEGSKLRFFYGMAAIPEAEELVTKLQSMVDGLHARAEEAELRAAAEAERATAEAERADELGRQLVKTREETLRLGIEGLCEVLAIELPAERRSQLDALDATGLEALQRTLRAERRWP